MKRKHFLIVFLLVFILAIVLTPGCKSKTKDEEKTTKVEKTEAQEEYVNPELLVDAKWLEDNLDDKDLRIIDLRKNIKYRLGHIEGALNLNIDNTVAKNSKIPGIVAPKDQIEELLSNLGISNDSHIVIYDEELTAIAGRVFWILEYYGHENVSVLDGGLAHWKKEGGKLTRDLPKIEETLYIAEADESKIATTEQVKDWLDNKEAKFVDSRPLNEFAEGHLEGGIQMDWIELLTDDKPALMKSADDLKETFKDFGIVDDKDLVLY